MIRADARHTAMTYHLIGAAVVAIVGTAAGLAVVLPTRTAHRDDVQYAQSLVQVASHEAAAQQRFEQQLHDLKTLGDSTRDVLSRIEDEPQLDAFLTHFSQLVDRNEGAIQHFQPLEPVFGEHAAAQKVRCRVKGDWETLVKILAALEDLPQLVWVERIRFTSPGDGPLTHCDLDLAVVFLPQGTKLHAIQQQFAVTPKPQPAASGETDA